ncbi:MobV family relaxase [Hungatella hathewayi]|uniref:MobV family relaxase n=1 Tax=Hungatella hathewayi TaxID=154046 RepID=UPI0035668185
MGYCFMTLEKIKNTNQMIAKYKHNYRKIDVLNADPEQSYLNEELVKLNDKTYEDAFNERMKTLGYGDDKKIRSNAVYAFEVVTTFSREDQEKIDLEEWKKSNVEWLRKEFNADPDKYGDNVISMMYHADEPGNVHCHAIVIPIDDKGHLNSRYYVRSRQKMIELQDSYGKLMKQEHDLDRGVKYSKARHQDIKRYYAALNTTLAKELPLVKEQETANQYRFRANELYKDSNLKIMALEDKEKRLKSNSEQLVKNAVSETRKEFYEKYQMKAETFEKMEREFGPFEEIKEKCKAYDNLIEGIAAQSEDDKEPIINLISDLIAIGIKSKEKSKNQDRTI